MKDEEIGEVWTTEALVLLGMWLLKKGETGYGLLCIHGPILGVKIGPLLKLKWKDFINPITDECHEDLFYEDDISKVKSPVFIELNPFVQRITEFEFKNTGAKEQDYHYDDYIYAKESTRKVLTTSTLNRELQKFYMEFKDDIHKITSLEMTFKPLKTSALEIAWGRDMVEYYALSKKSFIAVSKYMGHRTLKHTFEVLGLEARDEIIFRFDMYNPLPKFQKGLESLLTNPKQLSIFLLNRKLAKLT